MPTSKYIKPSSLFLSSLHKSLECTSPALPYTPINQTSQSLQAAPRDKTLDYSPRSHHFFTTIALLVRANYHRSFPRSTSYPPFSGHKNSPRKIYRDERKNKNEQQLDWLNRQGFVFPREIACVYVRVGIYRRICVRASHRSRPSTGIKGASLAIAFFPALSLSLSPSVSPEASASSQGKISGASFLFPLLLLPSSSAEVNVGRLASSSYFVRPRRCRRGRRRGG